MKIKYDMRYSFLKIDFIMVKIEFDDEEIRSDCNYSKLRIAKCFSWVYIVDKTRIFKKLSPIIHSICRKVNSDFENFKLNERTKEMNNKKLGNSFETELCEILSKNGFWVHLLNANRAGQPADILAVRNKVSYLIDAKVCSEGKFPLSRICSIGIKS